MSRLGQPLLRLFGLDEAGRVGRRLERERPMPQRAYAGRLRRLLVPRSTPLSVGSGVRRSALILITVGFALLAVAAIIAGS
jgi:hypothetical protein